MLLKSGLTASVGVTLALLIAGPAAAHVHHHYHHHHHGMQGHGDYGAMQPSGCGKNGGHDRDNGCDSATRNARPGSSSGAPSGATKLDTNRNGGHDRDNGGKAK